MTEGPTKEDVVRLFEAEVKRMWEAEHGDIHYMFDDVRRVRPLVNKEARPFWRVVVRNSGTRKSVGFFDIRSATDGVLRTGLLNPPSQGRPGDVRDVSEMSASEVIALAGDLLGSSWAFDDEPELIFDGAETRVAWLVAATSGGRTESVLVTPGFAFKREN